MRLPTTHERDHLDGITVLQAMLVVLTTRHDDPVDLDRDGVSRSLQYREKFADGGLVLKRAVITVDR